MEHMQLKRLECKSAIATKVYVTMLDNCSLKLLPNIKIPFRHDTL